MRRWAPGGREVARYSGVYEDLFWPDPGSDIHLDLQQMTVTKGGWEASAAPVGPRALRCHHGLLELDRTGARASPRLRHPVPPQGMTG